MHILKKIQPPIYPNVLMEFWMLLQICLGPYYEFSHFDTSIVELEQKNLRDLKIKHGLVRKILLLNL